MAIQQKLNRREKMNIDKKRETKMANGEEVSSDSDNDL